MPLSREEMFESLRTLDGRVVQWAPSHLRQPIGKVPGNEVIYYRTSLESFDVASKNWNWGLFVPERIIKSCKDASIDHFRVIYGFRDDNYLQRIFFADPSEMNLISTQKCRICFGGELGWDIPFSRWSFFYPNLPKASNNPVGGRTLCDAQCEAIDSNCAF